MGLMFEDDSRFSQQIFDKYATKLEHKEEQARRSVAKLSDKLRFNKEDIGKVVYNKNTTLFEEKDLEALSAEQGTLSVLQMPDEVFEVEKNRTISELVEKNPKVKINSVAVQKEIRKLIAEKYGAKEIMTESDLNGAKIKLKKVAAKQQENMYGRVRIASAVTRGASHIISEQGAAREKDVGTEALIKANRYTKRFRRELVHMAFTPHSVIRSQRLSKLERKQSKLEKKQNDRIMKEFFYNVRHRPDAVMRGLKPENARVEGLAAQSRNKADYRGKRIAESTEKSRDVIMKEMQKKSNRRKYRKAISKPIVVMDNSGLSFVRGSASSSAINSDIRLLFGSGKGKGGNKKGLVVKLLSGCLISFLIGTALMACFILIAGLLFVSILSKSNVTTDWSNITAITDDFTKKETDYVSKILKSKEPVRTDIKIDEYEWYVSVNGTETKVDSEVIILNRWNGFGQADQNKLIAFICTLQVDATLEKAQKIIDDVIGKMYNLSVKVVDKGEEACNCGCQSNSLGDEENDKESSESSNEGAAKDNCGCPNCTGAGSTKYVQVTKFTINGIDKVIDELYDQYISPEKKEQLLSYYNTYCVTRGGNVSLGNPFYYNWYNGTTSSPSSYNGWRFIDRNDGKGYTVEHHKGLDIPAYEGASLYMPFDGTVLESGFDNSRGNYVVLLNKEGNTKVTYMHMSFRFVSKGDEKQRAYTVGSVGSTGDSTGPHLHVDVQTKDKSGKWKYVNPLFIFSTERVYKNSYGEVELE